MMGHRTKQFKLFAPTNLDALVPPDNFYRRLEEKLDLSFVRDLVRDCYEELGRPSIDPVVFFKLQLIAFFERITSERRLMETAQLNLAHHWYLGYDLDEPLPNHSSLSKIRSRYGVEVFHRFFERIVELCIEAGLVEGEELYLDATRVDANASIHHLRTRLSVVAHEHVQQVFAANAEQEEAAQTDETPRVAATSEQGQVPPSLSVAPPEPQDEPRPPPFTSLVEAYRHGYRSKLRKSRYTRVSDSRYSPSDPDARLMKAAIGTRARIGYHDHYIVDGGKARIILEALVTPASIMENGPMLDLVRRARFRWQLRPRQATGDTTYGTTENIIGLEDDGIRAFVPLPDLSQRTAYFPAEAFTYDAPNDRYLCPQGQELRPRIRRQSESVFVYQADAAGCNACPVKSRCTASANGRQVFRSFFQSYLDTVKGYRELPAYKRALRKRQVWLEPLFGEAKVLHGLRRFRLRGLHKTNIEGLMVAAGQNLKRLLRHRGARPVSQPLALLSSLLLRFRRRFSPLLVPGGRPRLAFAR